MSSILVQGNFHKSLDQSAENDDLKKYENLRDKWEYVKQELAKIDERSKKLTSHLQDSSQKVRDLLKEIINFSLSKAQNESERAKILFLEQEFLKAGQRHEGLCIQFNKLHLDLLKSKFNMDMLEEKDFKNY